MRGLAQRRGSSTPRAAAIHPPLILAPTGRLVGGDRHLGAANRLGTPFPGMDKSGCLEAADRIVQSRS